MGPRSMSGADGLQVVPDQSGLHVIPGRGGLEVTCIEQYPNGSGSFIHKAYGREEKIWDGRSSSSILPEVASTTVHIGATQSARGRKARRLFWFLLVLGFIVLAGLAIGLGVGLTQRDRNGASGSQSTLSSSSSTTTPSSTPGSTSQVPTNSSTTNTTIPARAARKNTGVLAFYPATEDDLVWLYWQDRTNDIRSLTYSYEGVWQNSGSLPVTDALNGTALAGTFYYDAGSNGSTAYMLMYVDTNGTLQNLVTDSRNTNWTQGNLGSANFKAPVDQRIALSSCGRYDPSGGTTTGGLILMAGGLDGLVHEYLYFYDNQSWIEGTVFAGTNGYAAAQPYIGDNGTAYLMTTKSGSSAELEFWWQTYSSEGLQPWTKGADSIGSVQSNSSYGFIGDVGTAFYVDGDSTLMSMNVTGDDAGRRWGGQNTTNVTIQSSSQMGWLYITDAHAEQSPPAQGVHLFAQTNDTNLIHFRGYAGNMSIAGDVPIFA